jgi:hypothetical protein
MGLHDPFDYLQHKLWSKEGQQSKCQFDSRPLKVRNRPELCVCRWRATYLWKALNKGYNFAPEIASIKGLNKKSWTSKVVGILILGISRLPTWESWEKWHLDATPWLIIENTIRGKVVTSPKSRPWWILWVYVCPWLVCAPKCSDYALTNLLFGLCRSIWIIDPLVTHHNPHPKMQRSVGNMALVIPCISLQTNNRTLIITQQFQDNVVSLEY